MADQAIKVAVIGAIGAVIVGIFGATQEPWWWCKTVGCSPQVVDKPKDPEPLVNELASKSTDKPKEPEYEIIPAQPERMGELLMGTNLHRSDINNGETVPNVQACRKLCADTAECKAMTYVYANVDDTLNGICWLKGAVPPASANPNMISAKKIPATPERRVLKSS